MKKTSANQKTLILGAGITGLAAGSASGAPIFEAESFPGGICSSYYLAKGAGCRPSRLPNAESYRFEAGGGHWIFGLDNKLYAAFNNLVALIDYRRKSAVYLPKKKLFIPYPLQNNLSFFDQATREKSLKELRQGGKIDSSTIEKWLYSVFGKTLCKEFFIPFHNLYTAGLFRRIALQDAYKSPLNHSLVFKGASSRQDKPAGYNARFSYPREGLGSLVDKLAAKNKIYYQKKAVKILPEEKKVYFSDGSREKYGRLISTLPLNKMMELTGIKINLRPDPYNSVLVLNIGAKRGRNTPQEHWLYIPESKGGFFRVGFYSNVNANFLPEGKGKNDERVSIYVERSFKGGVKPSAGRARAYSKSVIKELQQRGFIGTPEVVDSSWVEVAYTWSWPGSEWREKALNALEKKGIFQLGRYARWRFQGIAESFKQGLSFFNGE